MIKIAITRLKTSTLILIFFIGLTWVLCSRFFNSGTSEAFYSEQKYHEDVSRIYYDLGKLSQRRGDLKKATRHFKNAIQADASYVKPYEALEAVYMLRKKSPKAQYIHQKAQMPQSNLVKRKQNTNDLIF